MIWKAGSRRRFACSSSHLESRPDVEAHTKLIVKIMHSRMMVNMLCGHIESETGFPFIQQEELSQSQAE